jgi:hypothetical protein
LSQWLLTCGCQHSGQVALLHRLHCRAAGRRLHTWQRTFESAPVGDALTGAGAAARRSMGTGVFGGMFVATFVATLFVPLFFTLLGRRKAKRDAAAAPIGEHSA